MILFIVFKVGEQFNDSFNDCLAVPAGDFNDTFVIDSCKGVSEKDQHQIG